MGRRDFSDLLQGVGLCLLRLQYILGFYPPNISSCAGLWLTDMFVSFSLLPRGESALTAHTHYYQTFNGSYVITFKWPIIYRIDLF